MTVSLNDPKLENQVNRYENEEVFCLLSSVALLLGDMVPLNKNKTVVKDDDHKDGSDGDHDALNECTEKKIIWSKNRQAGQTHNDNYL